MSPEQFKVVIFGQDPYPRETSATGIAFYDGEVASWSDKLSPSLRNIIKASLMSGGLATPSDSVAVLRRTTTKKNILQPKDWFEYTMNNGVLWLNTALTFSGKEKQALDMHTKFWAPVIEEIIKTLLISKENSSGNKGIVFALWGSNAQKLHKIITKYSSSAPSVKIESSFVPHPCTNTYIPKSPMNDINNLLSSVSQQPINWCPTY